MKQKSSPQKVLFVCLGNICRSPSAEAVFRKKSAEENLNLIFDSAGTIGHHSGEKSDPRSIRHAADRGYEMNHSARKISLEDFEVFDLVLVMDHKNYMDVLNLCPEGRSHKVKKIREFRESHSLEIVPDPYYGSADDFELVLDLIEDSWLAFKKHYFPSAIP